LRKNYINWNINRLNFKKVKKVKLEDNSRLHYKNYKGRKLAHNSWSLIKEKLQQRLSETGVQLQLVSCSYRSQRCRCCGWVQKDNRRKKLFYCLNCGHNDDADHNSSWNQLVDLPHLGEKFRKKKMNIDGFFWLPDGLSNKEGQALGVPDAQRS